MPSDRNTKPANEAHPELLDLELYRTGEASEAVQVHVEQCPICREELERLKAASDVLRTPQIEISVPPKHEAEILDFIRDRASQISKPADRILYFRFLKLAAGIAAALVIGGLALRQGNRAATTPRQTAVPTAPGDINQDGTVDVIDAMLLAKEQKSGNTPDVKQLMARIVAIDKQEQEI